MNPLFNAKGEQLPPRPELTDEMKKAGALKAVKSGHLSRVDEDDAEQFSSDVAKHHYDGIDAYDLAKKMETDSGWDVDSMFVDDMEQVDSCIREVLRNAINDWARVYEPVPPFELGTELQVYSFSTNIHGGVIDGICEHTPATYLVKMYDRAEDDKSRRLVSFEDAKLRALNVGDVEGEALEACMKRLEA
ncbi:TPA: hypothetical protein I7117_15070 [Vibrio vulnificus]|uniref:hypothetical protein n=1 Tax=Vibrio navarrensis TaxID=29495 RepID=UPI0018DDE7A8|nr:hypothetical protein [Vibrio navarrensis]EHA1126420.1 hypothetical protein [Vibrio navarrensis]MBH9739990.1 hypothetical protein [Vibrio navarrensis]HAS6100784.1 hypothetical protein [Vibrio vulnificus]HDY8121330.1 hypothetical protein [Vibrio vulnificus]